ncbi:MAG: glycerol-3-phosphate transporter permease, partial [Proteobacteria bacterium]|nr:glycerol-3-phosphate transporter permease [Pseudomonadota bacterium]
MEKRVVFKHKFFPYFLIAPQIIITLVFFIWPASQAIYQSVLQEDAFGLSSKFVGLDNFAYIFTDEIYLNSIYVTIIFSFFVAAIAMSVSLLLATMADRVIKGATTYKTLIIWPYAVAPAVAGVLWYFLFNPTVGIVAIYLKIYGYDWNHSLNGGQAMFLVIITAAWREISYNFLFFL